jgi:hypothetical protein
VPELHSAELGRAKRPTADREAAEEESGSSFDEGPKHAGEAEEGEVMRWTRTRLLRSLSGGQHIFSIWEAPG